MSRSGFTLIEILVVLAILGILYAIALPIYGVAKQKAQIVHVKQQLVEIRRAIAALANDTGYWPAHKSIDVIENTANNNEIWDLTGTSTDPNGNVASVGLVNDTEGTFSNWKGPYISEIPLDPWGHSYFLDTDYQIDSNNNPCQTSGTSTCIKVVTVGSFGPDGIGQNVYNSDDVFLILAR